MQRAEPTPSPIRPARLAEHCIVTGILDGTFSPGKPLPSERRLAAAIGVARPLLRETLHRLANEGWLTIAHGKPTLVNDYWEQGGMGLLSTLARHIDSLPADFVDHLLDVRRRLLPIIADLAAHRAPEAVLACLDSRPGIDDAIAAFVDFDWQLQLVMASQTGNPIYKLMFNDFGTMYATLANIYFAWPAARDASMTYYRELGEAIRSGGRRVESVVRKAMDHSMVLWQRLETDRE